MSELHVLDPEAGQLRAAQAGLDGDQEQRVVAPTGARVAIGHGEQGLNVEAGQVVDLPLREFVSV